MSLAAIERLPVELLQPIFASSGYNIALVRASHVLGTRLSSEYVYHNTCDYYLTERCEDYARRSTAQSAIFASRWMTWSFFKSWITRAYESNGCLCGSSPDHGCFDAQWPPNFENATAMTFSRSHLPRLAFVRCRLPKKLLSGPWTKDKVDFLRFLLWITSMTVDWRDPETCQLTKDGRRQAFLENNLEAVELFNNNRRLGRPPTLETVCFAVTEADCSRSIIYDTLRSAYRSSSSKDSWDDPILYQWCDQRIWDNDSKGVWLRGILQVLHHAKLGSHDKSTERDVLFGKIADQAAEAYGNDFEDKLIRNELPWNKERRQIGWFYWSRHDSRKMGVHRVTREDLGDFWKHRNGHYRTMTGLCRNGREQLAPRESKVIGKRWANDLVFHLNYYPRTMSLFALNISTLILLGKHGARIQRDAPTIATKPDRDPQSHPPKQMSCTRLSRPLITTQLLQSRTYSLVSKTFPPNFFAESSMSSPAAKSPTPFPATPYKPRYEKWPYNAHDFQRQDETDDGLFYRQPRLVTHIDDPAIENLTAYYDTVLPRQGKILDMCTSWKSFYPASIKHEVQKGRVEVYGVGLNAEEMGLNGLFQGEKRWRVMNLNKAPYDPRAGWPGAELRFDAVTCVVSIDYLNHPLEVCRNLLDAINEGGTIHLAISNRCFPNKIVRRWMMLNEQSRLEFVGDYLHFSGWNNVEIVDLCARDEKGQRITDDHGRITSASAAGRLMGHLDPLWVVRARKDVSK
ncbi:hypothetical protein OPT61_g46 [Boeremia exigua]|uniref:Uncharacterized protein n=1 Tax=Boeremia exigua TaxID=749465 RepID=A0ACC2IV48_9PLEO|nr:hypothetical protein OPT61_g46 [Boeremia exigua]